MISTPISFRFRPFRITNSYLDLSENMHINKHLALSTGFHSFLVKQNPVFKQAIQNRVDKSYTHGERRNGRALAKARFVRTTMHLSSLALTKPCCCYLAKKKSRGKSDRDKVNEGAYTHSWRPLSSQRKGERNFFRSGIFIGRKL